MRQRLITLQLPTGPMLHRDDYVAAFRIFLLVVFATFPVVLPFLLTDSAALAMEASRIVTLVMLFLAGFSLGRHTWHPHPTHTGFWMTLLGVALILAVKALGG
jgi:VIT1/CCC1 family predicted Fe2+/Mn2+ transporter